MGTAIKHPVPNRVKPSVVIFDIWALCRSAMKTERHQQRASRFTSYHYN